MSEDVATQLRRDVEYCAWLRARVEDTGSSEFERDSWRLPLENIERRINKLTSSEPNYDAALRAETAIDALAALNAH